MLEVTAAEIKRRLEFDNPWWTEPTERWLPTDWKERAYLDDLLSLVRQKAVNRAVILMGPRRVGKTVMITQAVARLIAEDVDARNIFYVSIDNPVFTNIALDRLFQLFLDVAGRKPSDRLYVFLDEIQYLRDWERHLKSLVDSYPRTRFVASGSAAAALSRKSRESGAGRFTEFILAPLNFVEFLHFRNFDMEGRGLAGLNEEFVAYANFGGFPESVMIETVRDHMARFVANDVIDKVLLRDIPSLYGIPDPQDLKRLFAVLAYNTGQEVSLEKLAMTSGIAKNTLRRYIEYLVAAFLVQTVARIDQTSRRFTRATHFKVYLPNPSIRAALFGNISASDEIFGKLAESLIVSQYVHTLQPDFLRYARWDSGEVDFVLVNEASQRPWRAVEVKWSAGPTHDLVRASPGLVPFCKTNELATAWLLTREGGGALQFDGIDITNIPLAAACVATALRPMEERQPGAYRAIADAFARTFGDSLPALERFGRGPPEPRSSSQATTPQPRSRTRIVR
jgi:hypothetical protein